MKLRAGEDSDLDGIVKLRSKSIKDLCGRSYSKEQLKAWLSRPVDTEAIERDLGRGNVYVFVEKGVVEGYVHVRSSARPSSNSSAYIEALYISKPFANKGYGGKLLKKIEDVIRKRSIFQMKITISKNAEDFFNKHGYEILGPNLRRTIGDQVLEFQPLFKKIAPLEKGAEE